MKVTQGPSAAKGQHRFRLTRPSLNDQMSTPCTDITTSVNHSQYFTFVNAD